MYLQLPVVLLLAGKRLALFQVIQRFISKRQELLSTHLVVIRFIQGRLYRFPLYNVSLVSGSDARENRKGCRLHN